MRFGTIQKKNSNKPTHLKIALKMASDMMKTVTITKPSLVQMKVMMKQMVKAMSLLSLLKRVKMAMKRKNRHQTLAKNRMKKVMMKAKQRMTLTASKKLKV